MAFWRIWAALLGASLMIGESVRSWGQGRHPVFVLDDFCVGVPLVLTAWLLGRPTPTRQRAFVAAFAASAGMLYGSFFGKVVDLLDGGPGTFASNIGGEFLTVLIGLAFAASLAGLVAAIRAAPVPPA